MNPGFLKVKKPLSKVLLGKLVFTVLATVLCRTGMSQISLVLEMGDLADLSVLIAYGRNVCTCVVVMGFLCGDLFCLMSEEAFTLALQK